MAQQNIEPIRVTMGSVPPIGSGRSSGTGNFNGGTVTNPVVPGSTFDTVINSIFMSTETVCQVAPPIGTCNSKELPCFYEFLKSCSPQQPESLVYGLYCLKHMNAANRTYAVMGTQTTVDLQPISSKPATCEKNAFLWSFLTNVSYAKARELIAYMNINTTDSGNLAKFVMIVSEPINHRQNSEEYQRLNQYLSAYCQSAIKCVEQIPDRDKILVPITMTEKFMADNAQNKLVADILENVRTAKYSYQVIDNTKQVYVPLKALNILDQIQLLSFRMYCGLGRVSLAPNVSITGDRVLIGSGLSVRNAISHAKIAKLLSRYPESVVRIIKCIHNDEVHFNYDVLVLLIVPNNLNSVINPQIFIAKRKFISHTFEIDNIDSGGFC